jgi:hypothetical protein
MFSPLLCSVDSLLASLGIGLWGGAGIGRRKLILAFAACDAGAALAGAEMHSGMTPTHPGGPTSSLLTFLLAVVAIAVFLWSRQFPARFLWMPALLGLDNFFASFLEGTTQTAPSLVVAGLSSGLAAWVGFALARQAGPVLSRRTAVVASACLLIFALFLAN